MDVIGIAALTFDGFIARHSHEMVNWTKDLSLFKKQTLGHTVVMGSNTEKAIGKELPGRQTIVVHRKDNPKEILKKSKEKKCFIIGGGKTFSKFVDFLTHLYLTPHPLLFGSGIKLFDSHMKSVNLKFEKMVPIIQEEGIFQFQFRIFR